MGTKDSAQDAQSIEQKEYIYSESNIESFVIAYFESIGVQPQDIKSEKQQSFTACLMAIGKQLFPVGYWSLPATEIKGCAKTNYNSINVYKLALLAQEYIYMINKYNKMASIYDFSYLANIFYTTVYSWANIKNPNYSNNTVMDIINNYINNNGVISSVYNADELNILRMYIYKIIQDSRKNIFEAKLLDTKQGVSLMYLGNNNSDFLPQSAGQQGQAFSLEGVADSLQIAQK